MTAAREDRTSRLLPLIAIERAVRGIVLLGVGVVLLTHTHTDWGHSFVQVARHLGLDTSRQGLRHAAVKLTALTPNQLSAFGAIAIAYGLLEGVEGYGLWLRRRWAEWLTVIATSLLFIPEIWELTKKATPLKVAGLLANIAIVIYLIARLRRRGD